MRSADGNSPAGPLDLHSHSTASDGSLSPTELVAAALEAGLAGLALTDHDTVEGLPEFLAAGRERFLPVLGGVEISLEHPGIMHMLGYDLDGGRELPAALERLQGFRRERNLKMLDLLRGLGYHLSWDRLLELSGGGQLGRPHFAALLLENGYFQSREEIFAQLLGKGCPGYVDKIRLSPKEGLTMLRRAGWAPVLAHPASLNLEPRDYPPLIGRLKEDGLLGLEVFHPSHSRDQVYFFSRLARDFDLAATAGSDFHGAAKPNISLDWVRSAGAPGWEIADQLRARFKAL